VLKKLFKAGKAFVDTLTENESPQTSSKQSKSQKKTRPQAQQPPPQPEPPKPPKPRLFTDWNFPFTEDLVQHITREIPEKIGKTPTQNQWKMILSRSVNTYVVAGAGSGKSTSLILRVLVLHHYMKIPLHQITVFSFTRRSTQDFREKLQEVFAAFGYTITDKIARQVVRTFHSKILELTRGLFSQEQLFEFLSPGHDFQDTKYDIGLFESRLNDTQEQYLKGVYTELFQQDVKFRALILELYKWHLKQITIKKWEQEKLKKDEKDYKEFTIQKAAERDRELTERVNEFFNPPATLEDMQPVQLNGLYSKYKFYANAYIPELDSYLVYTPLLSLLGEQKDEKIENFPLAACLSVKQQILLKWAEANIIFIHNERDMTLIAEQARWFQNSGGQIPPSFPYIPDGEFIVQQIWNSFYSTALFIESMGLDVAELEDFSEDDSLSSTDQYFLGSLVIFWEAFMQKLKQDRIGRFHDLFSFLSEKKSEHFQKLSKHAVESMSHILIDEFQDISPEVVYWIRGILKHQQSLGIYSSLMCVGDDWQSIYGWRGSSPLYFIDYPKEFPDGSPYRVNMSENFRSYQGIIDGAEVLLNDLRYKTQKHGIAVRGNLDEPVHLFRLEHDQDILPQLHEILAIENHGKEQELMILSRTNDTVRRIRESLRKAKMSVKLLTTFHQSKGLEADICILVGDCGYTNTAPLKNLIYDLAGFPQSYDGAQSEEARRLAYVGITRARNRCYWVAVPRYNGAFEILSPPEPEIEEVKPLDW
jgi:superfamily I DNA/RNA helicase